MFTTGQNPPNVNETKLMQNVQDDVEEGEDLQDNEDQHASDTTESQTDESASEEQADDSHDSKDRARNQIERLKRERDEWKRKAEEAGQGGSKSGSQGSQAQVAPGLVERTFLAAEGYKEKEVQEEVLKLANKFGLSVDEALEDPDIRLRADGLQKRLQAQQASSRPTGKGGATSRDAQWYADKGILPDDPKLVPQVWKILAEREK